ncbi:alpha-tectorin-like, partial [Mustelus asterias]
MSWLLIIIIFICPVFNTSQAAQATITPTNPDTSAWPDPCSGEFCTEWESCGLRSGKYGCRCSNVSDSESSKNFDAGLSCQGENSSVSLSRCMLFDAGFSSRTFHLNDPRCGGNIRQGRLIFSFASNRITCGNKLQVGDTQLVLLLFSACSQRPVSAPSQCLLMIEFIP